MPWHAIQTMSNREARIDAEISSLGLEHYLPVFREKRKRFGGRKEWVSIPVFRGYTFVQCRPSPELALALAPYGLVRFVGEVSEQEIQDLRLMMATGAKPVERHWFNKGE